MHKSGAKQCKFKFTLRTAGEKAKIKCGSAALTVIQNKLTLARGV